MLNLRYDRLRGRLAEQISQINSVANYDGKGRDDLSIQILIAAESMLRKISPNQSKSVRKLAENIRTSFLNISRCDYYREECCCASSMPTSRLWILN